MHGLTWGATSCAVIRTSGQLDNCRRAPKVWYPRTEMQQVCCVCRNAMYFVPFLQPLSAHDTRGVGELQHPISRREVSSSESNESPHSQISFNHTYRLFVRVIGDIRRALGMSVTSITSLVSVLTVLQETASGPTIEPRSPIAHPRKRMFAASDHAARKCESRSAMSVFRYHNNGVTRPLSPCAESVRTLHFDEQTVERRIFRVTSETDR